MKHGASFVRSDKQYAEFPIWLGLALFLLFFILRYPCRVYFFFTAFAMLAGLALAGYGMLNFCINRGVLPRAASILRRAAHVLLVLFALSFLLVQILILSGGSTDATYEEHYALVLGAGLDGETPSLSMQSRIDAAIEYWKQNPDVTFIACGGMGDMETITEAEAIRRGLARADSMSIKPSLRSA